MNVDGAPTDDALTRGMDSLHVLICRAQRDLFLLIAEADRRRLWEGDGARDMAHWLWMRYGVSDWKARRWIVASHALGSLPLTAEAFLAGRVGIDKVVELCRFVSADSEDRVLPWAEQVSAGAIRRKADLAEQRSVQEAGESEAARTLSWRYLDQGRRFGLHAELPSAQGAVVARALERVAEELPVMPGEEGAWSADARRADALVALASARVSGDPDPERATIVVHTPLETVLSGRGSAEVEGGGIVHSETARRLLCTARLQSVIEDDAGNAVRLGRMRREPPPWMMRQLRYRDRECRFPGCGDRQFIHAHHIRWWADGGPTNLDNLLLLCGFHHKLVHEHRWTVCREPGGTFAWFRADGTRYQTGPVALGGAEKATEPGPIDSIREPQHSGSMTGFS
jgi:hypothetical protein